MLNYFPSLISSPSRMFSSAATAVLAAAIATAAFVVVAAAVTAGAAVLLEKLLQMVSATFCLKHDIFCFCL